jgi:hypothetical protein
LKKGLKGAMNYPDDWPCKCGATKEFHTEFYPMDNLDYVEWLEFKLRKRAKKSSKKAPKVLLKATKKREQKGAQ